MAAANPFIHGRSRYRVVAPVVVAKLSTGTDQYVYQHGILPMSTQHSQITELLRLGMVAEFEVSQ